MTAREASLALLALLPFTAAPEAAPQKKELPGAPEAYTGGLDAARRMARDRNALLVVAAIQEGEEANDRFRDGVYKDQRFIAATLEMVVVLVNDGTHEQKTLREQVDGEIVERQVCAAYETPSCADHKRNWDRVYQEFNRDGAVRTPQLLVILPDGELEHRIVDEHSVSAVVEAVTKTQKKVGPFLTRVQLLEVQKQLGIGRQMMENRTWAQAWRAWEALLAVAQAGVYADEARTERDKALAGMGQDIEDALARIAAGSVVAGYASLKGMAEPYAGSPLERDLKKAVRDVLRNKEWRKLIEAWEREQEAATLWREIEDHLSRDEVGNAERIARRLLRRYGDTEAAEKARKEFPELAREEKALSASAAR